MGDTQASALGQSPEHNMQFFVPTLQAVSKMNIEGNHRTDTDLSVASNGLGQQHASAGSWMRYFATLGGRWPETHPLP